MPRRTVGSGSANSQEFDYGPLINPGITMLKFGRNGKPHERLFKLSGDLRYLRWRSGYLTGNLGRKRTGKYY